MRVRVLTGPGVYRGAGSVGALPGLLLLCHCLSPIPVSIGKSVRITMNMHESVSYGEYEHT